MHWPLLRGAFSQVFHKLDEIGNNASIGIRGFTLSTRLKQVDFFALSLATFMFIVNETQ